MVITGGVFTFLVAAVGIALGVAYDIGGFMTRRKMKRAMLRDWHGEGV